MAVAKNKKELFLILKKYLELEGMSRYEDDIAKTLKESTKECDFDYSRDGMGSLIMNKKGNSNGPKIQIAAHMDEVGFLVRDITNKGMLKLSMVGGVWPTVVIGTHGYLTTSTNKKIVGLFGHTSVHIMKKEDMTKAIKLENMYFDIGLKTKKEAEKLGIQPGDRVQLSGYSHQMKTNDDLVFGKAMDNRAGVTVIDQVAQRLKGKNLPNKLYIVGTTQEEVGTRGARTSVSSINPDVAIAIDTCAAHDTPGAIPGIQELGKGVTLRVKDSGTMMDPKLTDYIFNLAKKHKIPCYKYVAQGGGTDAAELQFGQGGVATLTLSIPQRYLHSPLGMASLTDIQAAIDLLTEFCLSFSKKEWESISYK